MAVEIPLFPLGVVLFPHMPLPLRIFERRYRAMMRDCEEAGTGFGVVAIREGVEVGGPATPHAVGTLAQLRSVERLDDGGYKLLVVGATRYRVLATSTQRPYLVGTVEYLEDTTGDEAALPGLAARTAAAFGEYADRLRRLAGTTTPSFDLPEDPELLSYLVAATVQAETARKQPLLEIDSTEERLRACMVLLRRESLLLERRLARRDSPIAAISRN